MPTSALEHVGDVKESTDKIAAEILAAVEAAGHKIHHIWGRGSSAEHATGRALDFMVYRRDAKGVAISIDVAAGDFIAELAWKNRARWGLIHEIWKQRIRSTVVEAGKWRGMGDRGNPTLNHLDHVHLFFNGTYAEPGKVVVAPVVVKKPAATRPRTKLAVDGRMGEFTVREWQRIMKTPIDGKISKPSMLVKAVQAACGMRAADRDGYLGPKTWRAIQRRLGVTVDGIPGPQTIRALQARLNTGKF